MIFTMIEGIGREYLVGRLRVKNFASGDKREVLVNEVVVCLTLF